MDGQPVARCPTMLKRALGLGFLGGFVIAELFMLTLAVLTGSWSEWQIWSLLVGVVAPVGGLAGMADGMFALSVVWLLGRPVRRSMPLASLLGGAAAAAVPALAWLGSLQVRWLLPFGPELAVAAFLAGAVLTWPVLTGRPWLPSWLSRRATD